LPSWRSMTKIAESGSIIQRHGSTGPDPHQNVMDPEHCDPSDNVTYLSYFLRNNVEDPHHLWCESGFAWSPWCGSDSWFYLMRIPDSLYPFGTDQVTDLFWWCESGFTLSLWYGSGYWSFLMRIRIHFIPLVRIRLLIFFDADPKTCGSGSGTLVFPSYLTWDDNCSPFYYGIYYFIRKGDGRGQGQALFSQPWGLDDPIYVSTVFYFIYVLLDSWGLQLYLLMYLLFSQEGFHGGDVAHNSLNHNKPQLCSWW
jgi:hypothetical protein